MNRPEYQPNPSKQDKLINVLSYLALLALWVMNVVAYFGLPDAIPIHYDASGEVDGYGAKATIFLLPVIGTVLFVMLGLLNKNPENFNYAVSINQDNAQRQYQNATRMMRVLKFLILIIFILIDFFTIRSAIGSSDGLGMWFLPLVMLLIFIPMGYFIYKSYQLKN